MSDTTTTTAPDLSRLHVDALLLDAVPFDWSEGFGEKWDMVYPDFSDATAEECAKFLDDEGDTSEIDFDYLDALRDLITDATADDDEPTDPDGWDHDRCLAWLDDHDIDHSDADDEHLEARREQCGEVAQANPDRWSPMMNYYYPLPQYRGDSGADQRMLDREGVACVLAEVDGDTVLALAGGGMDLAADICRAYVLLGYLPPVEFCKPSSFYRGEGKRAPWLIAACRKSWEVVGRWAAQGIEDFDRIAAESAAGKD